MFVMVLLSAVMMPAAAAQNMLIEVGGKTVTENMAVSDVIRMFGEPKLVTPSVFGGSCYTYYGDGYSDFLYIETGRSNEIVSFGSVAPGFKSESYSSGDERPHTYYISYLSGTVAAYGWDPDLVYGYVGYTEAAKKYDLNTLIKKYDSDIKYIMAMERQTVEMINAISVLYGDGAVTRFDERAFYVNRQLWENKSTLYEYCNSASKSAYFRLISYTPSGSTVLGYSEMYNPLTMASLSYMHSIPEGGMPVFYNVSGCQLAGYLMPDFFAENERVEYTDDEKKLLADVRAEYMASVERFNSSGTYFDKEPDYELPLDSGKINIACLEGAVGYLNTIRIGAGLDRLEHSETLSAGAQCKAILTHYIGMNDIPNPDPHFPPQPDGVPDEFYSKAQMGGGENLYTGDIIGSITNALHDGYGDPVTCGHRYNLLDPNYIEVGLGSTQPMSVSYGTQGVHKFTGYRNSDVEMVGWPSKGIMIKEALSGSGNNFTAKFYKGYKVTEDTQVEFTCLNTGNSISFTKDDEFNSVHQFYITPDYNMVTYYDGGISLVVGNVYLITVKNVVNTETGEITDYSYRSVYETAYGSGADEDTSVKLSTDSVTIPNGRTLKVKATVSPADSSNKMVWWSSSDSSVATVNENGYITAVGNGTAVVTARTDSGGVAYVAVTVTDFLPGDADNDGKVTVSDMIKVKNLIMTGSWSEEDLKRADMNDDKTFTVADMLAIKNIIMSS